MLFLITETSYGILLRAFCSYSNMPKSTACIAVDQYAVYINGVPITVQIYIAGKFGEFGGSTMIRQTKTIQISVYN